MQSYKKIIKNVGGHLFKSFIFPLSSLNGMRIILMYHRVINESPTLLCDPAMYITVKTLELHIRELSKYFEIVPLDMILENDSGNKRLCAITFDDGWTDNYEYAFPVLKKYNVPATIFVPVGMIGTKKRFWFQEIWEIALRVSKSSLEKEFIQYFSNLFPDWMPRSTGVDDVYSLISRLKYLPADEVDEIVRNVYRSLSIGNEEAADILSWEQIREMGCQGITFGSHGLNHYILSGLNSDIKRMEIVDSHRLLKDMDVPSTPFFCYPNGDWDSEVVSYVINAGYRGAVTTNIGYNASTTDPFLLNRIGLHEDISDSSSLLWFRLFQAQNAGCTPSAMVTEKS